MAPITIKNAESQENFATTTKFYGFHTFAEPGCFPVSLSGAFRDNVRQFLQHCAEPQDYCLEDNKMPVWCTFLVYESRGVVLPLYSVEEDVDSSDRPFCDYCRCSGWSHHFVSKRKYHFIIPANGEWNKPLDENAFDIQTHLLHGLIHCNGYGHLICINGIEGGSKYICGRETMDLWDRICAALHARKITVEDLSKKHTMDARLLYGVTHGQSLFNRWGYRFSHGSFGVKEHNYERALDILSSMELDQVIDNFSFHMKQIIDHYRCLGGTELITIRDLFRFMLSLKNLAPMTRCTFKFNKEPAVTRTLFAKEKPTKCRKFSNLAANLDSRWPVKRLEHVAEVIVHALKDKRAANSVCSWGMTRQEARDAARLHIGDTGLIDHVLKVMNNVIVGKYVVRRAVNRSTKVLEYTIHDLNGKGKQVYLSKLPQPIPGLTIRPGRSVLEDVAYLYKNVLMMSPDASVQTAVQVILHSKHFVKEWPFRDEEDDYLRFICRLTTSSLDLKAENFKDFPPKEYIVVPLYATLGDLKIAIQNAMRDTYCVMEEMQVTDLVDMEEVEDDEVLFGVIESGSEIWVRGCGLDLENDLRFEGGNESWTVRCNCGARDDDGERMVSCDICETWLHTLCNGIEDTEAVPKLFVCDACCSSLAPVQTMQCGYRFDCEPNEVVPVLRMPRIHDIVS